MTLLTIVGAFFGIGFLIFVHELGHFVAAKLCKVKVDTFAIGFQPTIGGRPFRIFAFTRGETEYVIGGVPFGGYVRMAGEEVGDEKTGDPNEYASKSGLQRAFILVAGSTMNLITGVVFFVIAYSIGVPFKGPKVGNLDPGSAAWEAGMQPGDVIETIAGEPMSGFTEISQAVATGGTDEPIEFVISRNGEKKTFMVTPRKDAERGFPTIGMTPAISTEVALVQKDSTAAEAGLEAGDVVERATFRGDGYEYTVDGGLLDSRWFTFVSTFARSVPDGTLVLVVDRDGEKKTLEIGLKKEKSSRATLGWSPRARQITAVQPGSAAAAVLSAGDEIVALDGQPIERLDPWTMLSVVPSPGEIEIELASGEKKRVDRNALVEWTALGAFEVETTTTVGFVLPGRPASRMSRNGEPFSLAPGDKVVAVGGDEFTEFSGIVTATAGSEPKDITLTIERNGERFEVAGRTEIGEDAKFGIAPRLYEITQKAGFPSSIALGFEQTKLWISRVFLTLKSLILQEVSPKNLSGPVGIISATQALGSEGIAKYLWILALISVNLGVFNLLPFPILDGGHLVFLAIEKIKGSPVPDAVVNYAHLGAFVVLIAFALFVTYNDIGRLLVRLGLSSGD